MLYKRKQSPFWWCRFQIDNREVRISTRTSNRSEAEEFETVARARAWRQARLGERPIVLWENLRKRWLAETEKRTKDFDETVLDWFDEHLKGQPITNITREVAIELRDLKAEETSKATANRYMSLLRAMLNKAAGEWQLIESAPQIKMFSIEKGEPRFITKEQFAKLAKELPEHQRAMATFGVQTGLRMSNVVKLTWDRVDLNRSHVWIPAASSKSKKPITVPINSEAKAVLIAQKGKHATFVFTFRSAQKDATDKPLANKLNTKAWRKAVKRAGLDPFRWHDLRHTWASWHVQAGTPLHVIQELGGWASLEMVQRYAHLGTEHLTDYVGNIGHKPAQRKRKIAKHR